MTKGDWSRVAKLGRSRGRSTKWCSNCSRRHKRRVPCDLYYRKRRTKKGGLAMRWCH